MSKVSNGVILYEGPSNLDGSSIICIATGLAKSSANSKTGNLIQTWIMPKDLNPLDAIKTLKDKSVCGDCKHRRGTGGACYVNVGQAPNNIWKTYIRGGYPKFSKDSLDLFKGKLIRFGAWGDPTAVPFKVWEPIKKVIKGSTGYTHQWKNCDTEYQQICMASVDNELEYQEAYKNGWRTFRVKSPNEPLKKGEFTCPASEEAGKKLTCSQCMACSGGNPPKGTVAINIHGVLKKRFTELTILESV